MLKLISLHAIQQIFETEATDIVSPLAKMCYINCIMHYFDGLPENLDNTKAFDLLIKDMKNYGKNHKYFMELQDVNLVIINNNTITFINHWYKYIDKTRLERKNPEEYLGMMGWRPAKDFTNDLLTNDSLYDLLGMHYSLSRETVTKEINLFIQEQETKKKHYSSPNDAITHFIAIMKKKANTLPKTSHSSNQKNVMF
jgi:hypothetical protein